MSSGPRCALSSKKHVEPVGRSLSLVAARRDRQHRGEAPVHRALPCGFDQPEPIVTVVPRVTILAIARGKNDVDHLPRRDEVNPIPAAWACLRCEFPEEKS